MVGEYCFVEKVSGEPLPEIASWSLVSEVLEFSAFSLILSVVCRWITCYLFAVVVVRN